MTVFLFFRKCIHFNGRNNESETQTFLNSTLDIVDIKPANMEELTEVITAAEFHPIECSTFAYSSSKGTVRLCDMRQSALCDRHTKSEFLCLFFELAVMASCIYF